MVKVTIEEGEVPGADEEVEDRIEGATCGADIGEEVDPDRAGLWPEPGAAVGGNLIKGAEEDNDGATAIEVPDADGVIPIL